MTQLEEHQKQKGEALYLLARRLGIHSRTVYKVAGHPGYGRRNKVADGSVSLESGILELISADTGIPIGTLYEEAAAAAKAHMEGQEHGKIKA